MAYGDFKDLAERTASDKVLKDKAFNIAKIFGYDGYQRGFASMVYKFFDKKSAGSGVNAHAKCKWWTSFGLSWKITQTNY